MKLDKTLSSTKTDRSRSPSKHAAAAPKPSAHYGDNARVTVCATQGGRQYVEDRLHVHVEHGNVDGVKHAFYAVYDGGSQAAEFSRKNRYQNLRTHFNSTKDDDVRNAIHDAFLQTHKDMFEVVDSWPRTASGFRSTAGTTASVALIRRGKMYTGHVGDSAIVACTTGKCSDAHFIVGTMLTTEHKPDAEEEQRRIVDHGGSIACKSGVMRVVWNRTRKGYTPSLGRRIPRPTESIPFLAVARSLGDLWSYNAESDEYIVSPKPDTDVIVLDASFKCIVLASDCLWNVMRAQNCVDIVNLREWRRFPSSTGVMSSCAEKRLPHAGTKAKRPTPIGTAQSHATEDVRRGTGENKYYCRKHGLQCDKVRQMNLHWSLDMSVTNDDVGSDEVSPRRARRSLDAGGRRREHTAHTTSITIVHDRVGLCFACDSTRRRVHRSARPSRP